MNRYSVSAWKNDEDGVEDHGDYPTLYLARKVANLLVGQQGYRGAVVTDAAGKEVHDVRK